MTNRLPHGFVEAVSAELYRGSLPDWQKLPLEMIYARGVDMGRDAQEIAYVMATGHHETSRWRYDEEIGKGAGRKYGEPIWLNNRKRVTYHGRGWVQLTWLANYAVFSRILGLDLVSNPDLVKDPHTACRIIWDGMVHGLFTGRKLGDYRTPHGLDYIEARRTVNGTDKAALIAGYARQFEAALNGGSNAG